MNRRFLIVILACVAASGIYLLPEHPVKSDDGMTAQTIDNVSLVDDLSAEYDRKEASLSGEGDSSIRFGYTLPEIPLQKEAHAFHLDSGLQISSNEKL